MFWLFSSGVCNYCTKIIFCSIAINFGKCILTSVGLLAFLHCVTAFQCLFIKVSKQCASQASVQSGISLQPTRPFRWMHLHVTWRKQYSLWQIINRTLFFLGLSVLWIFVPRLPMHDEVVICQRTTF